MKRKITYNRILYILIACSCYSCGTADRDIDIFGKKFKFGQELHDFDKTYADASWDENNENGDSMDAWLREPLALNETLNDIFFGFQFKDYKLGTIYCHIFYVNRGSTGSIKVSPQAVNTNVRSLIKDRFKDAKLVGHSEEGPSGCSCEIDRYRIENRHVNFTVNYETDSLVGGFDHCEIIFWQDQ